MMKRDRRRMDRRNKCDYKKKTDITWRRWREEKKRIDQSKETSLRSRLTLNYFWKYDRRKKGIIFKISPFSLHFFRFLLRIEDSNIISRREMLKIRFLLATSSRRRRGLINYWLQDNLLMRNTIRLWLIKIYVVFRPFCISFTPLRFALDR